MDMVEGSRVCLPGDGDPAEGLCEAGHQRRS